MAVYFACTDKSDVDARTTETEIGTLEIEIYNKLLTDEISVLQMTVCMSTLERG